MIRVGVLAVAVLLPGAGMAQEFPAFPGGGSPLMPVAEMAREVETSVLSNVAAVWGKEARLPEIKTWVGYEAGLKTRVIIDYENGTMTVESVEPGVGEGELKAALDRALRADSRSLDSMDVFALGMQGKMALVQKEMGWSDTEKLSGQAPGAPPALSPRRSFFEEREIMRFAGTAGTMKLSFAREPGALVPSGELQRLTVRLPADYMRKASEQYRPLIVEHARKNNLAPSLVASVIKNESAFNPRARSHVPAFGLMQIVPTSAGHDALSLKLGRKAMPSPEHLYDPAQNVELGSIYLRILDTNYLQDINDPRSRLYCSIAAYNTGAGNVARGITGGSSTDALAAAVNRMSPDQVYQRLVSHLPSGETRAYLVKVTGDLRTFAEWDGGSGGSGAPSPAVASDPAPAKRTPAAKPATKPAPAPFSAPKERFQSIIQ